MTTKGGLGIKAEDRAQDRYRLANFSAFHDTQAT